MEADLPGFYNPTPLWLGTLGPAGVLNSLQSGSAITGKGTPSHVHVVGSRVSACVSEEASEMCYKHLSTALND